MVRQLSYAPPDRIRGQVERAEELAEQIERGASYPVDWLVYRLTGYRGEDVTTRSVSGGVLLAELSAFVERLSHAGGLTLREEPGAVVSGDLTRRWGVNRKTLERWRRDGLVGRRLIDDRGRSVLAFSARVVAAYERRHAERLRRAGAFSRLSESERERIEALASTGGARGESTTAAARRMARATGRSVGAVKRALVSSGRGVARTPEEMESRRREAEFAWRLWRRGFDAPEIARRLGRPRTVVLRAINLERASRLRACLNGVAGSDAQPQWTPQPLPPICGDVAALVELARHRIVVTPRQEAREHVLLWSLRASAAAELSRLDRNHPSAEALDEIESRLRAAARVKAVLLRPLLSLIVETAEGVLGGPMETLRPAQAAELLAELLAATCADLDTHEPGRVGRLAAPVALAVHRLATSWVKQHHATPARSAARAAGLWTVPVAIEPFVALVSPWQASMDLPPAGFAAWPRMGEPERAVLAARFGLEGERPRTLAELAKEFGVTRIQAARLDCGAWRALAKTLRRERA